MYSIDLRNSAVRHYLAVRSLRKVAAVFNVGKSTIDRWVRPIHTARNARRKRSALAVSRIQELVTSNPFTTLAKLKRTLADDDIKISCTTASFTDFLTRLDAAAGDPVILDNVSFHRSKAAIEAARVKGFRLLYTPPYSPDFNPVENAFSVLRNAMRQNEPVALRDALTTITVAKCAAFFG
jgi:transposase